MNLVFYDNTCKFCDSFVNYVIDHDTQDQFRFAALQGELAQQKLKTAGFDPADLDTVYVITDFDTNHEQVFQKSTAIFTVLKQLGGLKGLCARFLLIIPAFIRNPFYSLFARFRYSLFGKLESCRRPTPEISKRFLD